MNIQIKAPEGFYQVGWQRVQAFDLDNSSINVSQETGWIFEEWSDRNVNDPKNEPQVYVCDDCFFVVSGESFKLEDLAEVLSDVLLCEVEAVNED